MEAVEQVQAPAQVEVTAVGSKTKKAETTGNFILDVAHDIETYGKVKTLNQASKLANNIEENYFILGGLLESIRRNSWYEGFENFEDFVQETYGFADRKARYLIGIYTNLVKNMIPWDKVQHLGWTKLKDLAPILTLENVDFWVEKATPLTVKELLAVIKEHTSPQGEGESEKSAKTTTNVETLKIKGLYPEQIERAQQALAKSKAELNTQYDNVAADGIFAHYLGNTTLATDLKTVLGQYTIQEVLNTLDELHKGVYEISIDFADTPEGQAAKAAAEGVTT